MNPYTDLVVARDDLRRTKDHEQTMRAIAEYTELSGKNADDRKRELAYILSQHDGWRKAQDDLRDCELAVDRCQAAIDQAEAERRENELALRREELAVNRALIDIRDRMLSQRVVNRALAQDEMNELFK